jgi:8-oxo-dGTP pyrophosphatase MutT (NUDIX family)
MMQVDSELMKILSDKYEVLAVGPFLPKQIAIQYESRAIEFSPSMLDFIEREWESKIKMYPGMYNGLLYHLDKYEVQRNSIELHLSDTNYKEYIGTRNSLFQLKYGDKWLSKPLSVGMVLVTADEQCVIGVRGGSVDSYHGKYATVAGYMDRGGDITYGLPDPHATVIRELFEETGVIDSEINKTVCLGFTGRKQTLAAFLVQLNISSLELSKKTPQDIEFVRFQYIKKLPDALLHFISSNEARIPTYTGANLILLGMNEFGVDWIRDFA